MIRPMQRADAPDVLALLKWMDDRPEREVFAPEARNMEDLRLESADKACVVQVDDCGRVRGYCGLAPLTLEDGEEGQVLEGPLGKEALTPLLRRALEHVGGSLYTFCARDNASARAALEQSGFLCMHATDFYELRREHAKDASPLPPECAVTFRMDPDAYRALYRAAGERWSGRLGWSRARLGAHFAREDVRLLVLRREGAALGFAELELGETARLTYLAVHPAERERGYGAALLREAVREAFAHSEVRCVRARAQDHEGPARKLYERQHFELRRSVVTYLRDADETYDNRSAPMPVTLGRRASR